MKIAFVTDWLQKTASSERSWYLVEEMFRLGHETYILTQTFSDTRPEVGGRKDGVGVYRYSEPVEAEVIFRQLKNWGADVLVVDAEGFDNKPVLNAVVEMFTRETRRSYLILNNDKYLKEINYNLYSFCLMPRGLTNPPSSRTIFIDEGIPTFAFPNMSDTASYAEGEREENEWRRTMVLPVHSVPEQGLNEGSETVEGYYLLTLEGKTNVKELLESIEYINEYKLIPKPVYLFCHTWNESLELDKESEFLLASTGYMASEQLANYFHYADGCVFVYPEQPYRSTSSSIRFAIGAGCPVIANAGKHLIGVEEAIVTKIPDAFKRSIIHGIVSHFTNLPFRKKNAERIRREYVGKMGWSAVAQQLDQVIAPKRLAHA